MVSGLTQYLGGYVDQKRSFNWLWKGRHVCLVDGTTLTMPDTDANQSQFPQQQSQQPGLGFPICRFVGLISLSSGMLLDAAIGPFRGKGATEQALLRTLTPSLQSGDLLLGDAFYPTWFFLAQMQREGVDVFNGATRISSAHDGL